MTHLELLRNYFNSLATGIPNSPFGINAARAGTMIEKTGAPVYAVTVEERGDQAVLVTAHYFFRGEDHSASIAAMVAPAEAFDLVANELAVFVKESFDDLLWQDEDLDQFCRLMEKRVTPKAVAK